MPISPSLTVARLVRICEDGRANVLAYIACITAFDAAEYLSPVQLVSVLEFFGTTGLPGPLRIMTLPLSLMMDWTPCRPHRTCLGCAALWHCLACDCLAAIRSCSDDMAGMATLQIISCRSPAGVMTTSGNVMESNLISLNCWLIARFGQL
jgi:hypothetical protein